MHTLIQDLRYGIRMLAKSPGFTVVAVLTLALGIGANTAIFSVVNAVLLAPLPYKDPGRLVTLWGANPRLSSEDFPLSPAVFSTWKAENRVFEEIAASSDDLDTITGSGEPEMVIGYDFSADYFHVLDAKPELGRTFLPEEDRTGGPNVAVLSDNIWRRRFNADPSIIGKTIQLGSAPFTVVGVMPPTFRYPDKVEIWTPLALPTSASTDWKKRYLRVIARLRPGVTLDEAQAQMSALAERIAREHPDTNTGEGVMLKPLRTQIAGDIRTPLLVLLGAVGFVLLIACVNVANLLLARAASREREVAIRTALGAGRLRLLRQMLTESVLLSLAGGVAGLLLAYWSAGFLLSLFPNNIANLSIPTVQAIPIDGRVLAFTIAATILTGFLFGLVPALRSSRLDVNQTLKESGRAPMAGSRERLFRSILVVAEIALSFVLLIGAGLLIKSFLRLIQGDLGFRPDNVLALEAFPSPATYPSKEPEKLRAYVDRSVENLRAIPGVESASAINFLPLTGFWGPQKFTIEGRPDPPKGQEYAADNRVVTPDYFKTMGIPLQRGRAFAAADGPDSPHVAVISASLARRFWNTDDPVGKRLNLGDSAKPDWTEIVGVVGDVHSFGLEEKLHDDLYRPFSQVYFPIVAFTVRAKGDPAQITAAAKAAIWAVNPVQPFYKIITMATLAAESLALRRVSMLLLTAFSSLALLLAAIGIYGVLSYAVAQRTHEIGIRAALGAQQRDVLRLVLGDGMRLALTGLGLGFAASLALTRLMVSLLYGVGAADPLTFAGVAALATGVALLACYLPARRAMRVDPIIALHYE
ncbi:MAG TPA: ABC transporter permease [Candidatus Acidoferrales bacterium]|jgi:putative ABC transport system permease protein|nr:ABC transporter permease [Candidatus Acidoferrales bacterium]